MKTLKNKKKYSQIYKLPKLVYINKKPETKKIFSNKNKGKPKNQIQSLVESPFCWLDKLILWTRMISLVSEDSLATKGQKNLSFSRHM